MYEIIKKLRVYKVQLKSLLSQGQRKLSHHIASRAITDSESQSSCDDNGHIDYKDQKPLSKENNVTTKENLARFSYLDKIL